MNDFYTIRQVEKTKKAHKCLGCMQGIPTGSKCSYAAGVYEGNFRAYYLCVKCRDYLRRNPEFDKESLEENGIRYAMLEDEEWRKERERFL